MTFNEKNGLASNIVRAIAIDSDGNKWFGTNKGVSKFDGKKCINFNNSNGLTLNIVSTIAIDADGRVWAGEGTSKSTGIFTFDGKQWSSYSIEDGLVSNNITAISADLSSNIWLGSFKGVTKLNTNSVKSNFQLFTVTK